MALSFTAQQARQLIQQHRNLLESLRDGMAMSQTYRRQLEGMVISPTGMDQFAVYARGELFYQRPADPNGIDRQQQLFRCLCVLHRLEPLVSRCGVLYEENAAHVERDIGQLTPCAGGLRRLFTSSQTKQQAEAAYKRLSWQMENHSGPLTESLTAQLQAAQNPTSEEVTEDIRQNEGTYRKLLQEIARRTGSSTLPEFNDLIRRQEAWEQSLDRAKQEETQSETDVQEAVNRLTAKQAVTLLEEIPVEEVNRDKGGYRVKTLRESGFQTMADIHRTSVYELANVKGISADGASAIKRIAEDCVRQSQKMVKLRLSVDDRTPEATELVTALYLCRRKKQQLADMEEYNAHYGTQAKRDLNVLKALGSGVMWLFYSDGEKNRVKEAYQSLREMMTGQAGQTFQKLGEKDSGSQWAFKPPMGVVWQDFTENTVRYFNLLESIVPGVLGNDDTMYGLPEDIAKAVGEQPFLDQGLKCELRRYQEWGVKYALRQGRVLLGDEMGLGKTVQAIAVMVSLRNEGQTHFMVVCPASVVTNWCREIARHSDLPVIKIHGNDRDAAFRSWRENSGAGVTTFETTGFLTLDDDFRFALAVVDEAHYIKNDGAKRTVNTKRLCAHASRLLFMTGTALENKVDEMVSLIRILQPSIAREIADMKSLAHAPQFRERIAPVYYRRKREDVLTELPELIENREWCSLMAVEEQAYEEAVLSRNFAAVRRVSWNVEDIARDSSKAARLRDILDDAAGEERKVIVFSFFLDTIDKISHMLGETCVGIINGSVSPQRRQELIDAFEQAPPGSVLAAQIQSGGTGLNIQTASVVVFCEPQLKPSIENQAVSRAYRMGQSRNVLVYRLLCENTVDERLIEMLANKQAIFDAFADESAVAAESVEIDTAGCGEILEKEVQRITLRKETGGRRAVPAAVPPSVNRP